MNKKLPFLFLALAFLFSGRICAQNTTKKEILSAEFQKHFDRYQVKGSFVAHDLKNNKDFFYDEERAHKPFSPASTFKIFNSLVGLETGVIPDTSYVIPWDSVQRGTYAPWHRANSLQSAFKYSVVWYYQELARRVGEEEMQRLVSLNKYGNENLNEQVDNFWLSDTGGKMRISQVAQIDFLKKLYHEELKFSKRSQQLVKGIMLMEEHEAYKLFAKTGMGSHDGRCYGWYVGWVEKEDNVYFFATNIEAEDYTSIMKGGRQGITMAILQDLGLI